MFPRALRWNMPAAAALVGVGFLLAVALVDPTREFMTQDDGWAYARSVEHLLRTGEYRLDAWSAANMPVQIYLAAALAKVFGYSFTILRVSTLLLLLAGLAGFYGLLRELGTRVHESAVLTLALLANPLVLMLAFTFMSDVQFMCWTILALWAYVRGLRRGSGWTIFLGSVAAGCAIGTRQFGVALIGGLVLAWLAAETERRPPWHRLAIALAVPLAISLWQVKAGLAAPNFTQAVRLHEQHEFLAHSPWSLARELAWRVATMLEYIGLLLLPLFPLLFGLVARNAMRLSRREHRFDARRLLGPSAAMLILAAYFIICAGASSPLTAREASSKVLPLHWMLPNAFWDHRVVMVGLAISGLVGATLLVWLLPYGIGRERLRRRKAEWLLLGGAGLSLWCLHLGYVQLNDTYLVGLLPFAMLIPARALSRTPVPRACLNGAAALSLVTIALVALWMRGDYNRQEAHWKAADKLLAAGVDLHCVGAGRHWTEYHGGFDRWLADAHPDFDHSVGAKPPTPPGTLHASFYLWMHERFLEADYQIPQDWELSVPDGWRVVDEVRYRNAFFAPRSVFTLARTDLRQTRGLRCEGTN